MQSETIKGWSKKLKNAQKQEAKKVQTHIVGPWASCNKVISFSYNFIITRLINLPSGTQGSTHRGWAETLRIVRCHCCSRPVNLHIWAGEKRILKEKKKIVGNHRIHERAAFHQKNNKLVWLRGGLNTTQPLWIGPLCALSFSLALISSLKTS